jgi:ABC-type sugar transport system substrate-binding protein
MTTDKVTDIVFVFPPAHGNLGAFRSHLGVAYLRAALARDGFSTTQYLNPNPRTVKEIAEDVLRRGPRLVGFRVYDANFALSIALARTLKRRRPDVQVVFGGPSGTIKGTS